MTSFTKDFSDPLPEIRHNKPDHPRLEMKCWKAHKLLSDISKQPKLPTS